MPPFRQLARRPLVILGIFAITGACAAASARRTPTASAPDAPLDDEGQLRALVHAHVTASAHDDLPAFVATLDPAAPLFGDAVGEARASFARHDFDRALVDARVLRVEGDSAAIAFAVLARSRTDATGHVATGIWLAKRRSDGWRLRETVALTQTTLATLETLDAALVANEPVAR